jgi:hypothetical protein
MMVYPGFNRAKIWSSSSMLLTLEVIAGFYGYLGNEECCLLGCYAVRLL